MIRFRIFIFFLFLTHYSTAQYIENKGQWPENVLFGLSEGNINYYIEKDGITVDVAHPHDLNYTTTHSTVREEKSIRTHAFKLEWKESLFNGIPSEIDSLLGYSNFISNNCYASRCATVSSFTLKKVWPDTDVHFSIVDGKLKYDYIVNGDKARIDINILGDIDLNIRERKLIFGTTCGSVIEN
ncbi:MAG: hypothetical protein GC193_05245, partial [Cryomorphaceae bacterium]|nr:hypothetical protein [Cryomorphaceae bacterium]